MNHMWRVFLFKKRFVVTIDITTNWDYTHDVIMIVTTKELDYNLCVWKMQNHRVLEEWKR